MSAAGPPQGTRPPGGAARSDVRGDHTSAVGPRDGRTITVDALVAYPDRVDVRTPSEFSEDRVPGAENHPVLDDAERARIGTMYAKESFAARRTGAALVARNIAAMLEGSFAARSRDWAPVVYCWRGGQRSRSLTHMLNEIGWRAVQLDGGYRAWRRYVIAQVETLPPRFRFEVVCGLTGSGKSRLIEALAAEGMQVLDLEALAKHRGSLLGDLPGEPQPSQKWFESQLVAALERLDPRRPVYVESESKRIGTVQVPDALLAAIRTAPCIRLDTPAPLRIALLKDEYAHYLEDAPSLSARLAHLVPLHGRKTIETGRLPPRRATGTRSSASSSPGTTTRRTRARSSATSRASATRSSLRRQRSIPPRFARLRARSTPPCARVNAAHDAGSGLTCLRIAYRLVNVFAEQVLAGNPLCVFEDARGLDDATMQALALQFNLSETTFVLPSAVATARVRIFTPTFEMPFAGHPTLGTAHVVRARSTCGRCSDARNAARA